jgi:hypothetical protein
LPKKTRADANWFLFKQRLGIREKTNRLFDEAHGTDTSPESLNQGAAGINLDRIQNFAGHLSCL